MSQQVRNFILEYCNENEKKDYIAYIYEKTHKTSWMEKALEQREKIISNQPRCQTCKTIINVYENGNCTCENGHPGYDIILPIIKSQLN